LFCLLLTYWFPASCCCSASRNSSSSSSSSSSHGIFKIGIAAATSVLCHVSQVLLPLLHSAAAAAASPGRHHPHAELHLQPRHCYRLLLALPAAELLLLLPPRLLLLLLVCRLAGMA
jgi:hypothetical protein